MKNTDKVTEYILNHAGKLAPEKIKALASVLSALKGENEIVMREPNAVPDEVTNEEMMQHRPVEMSDVMGIQYDDEKIVKTKIYKT